MTSSMPPETHQSQSAFQAGLHELPAVIAFEFLMSGLSAAVLHPLLVSQLFFRGRLPGLHPLLGLHGARLPVRTLLARKCER